MDPREVRKMPKDQRDAVMEAAAKLMAPYYSSIQQCKDLLAACAPPSSVSPMQRGG